MTDLVYIADFTEDDRDILLKTLWESTIDIQSSHSFKLNSIKLSLLKNNSTDYICGRRIGISLLYNTDTIDPYTYDMINGIGSVQEIVENIRVNKNLIDSIDILTGIETLAMR